MRLRPGTIERWAGSGAVLTARRRFEHVHPIPSTIPAQHILTSSFLGRGEEEALSVSAELSPIPALPPFLFLWFWFLLFPRNMRVFHLTFSGLLY